MLKPYLAVLRGIIDNRGLALTLVPFCLLSCHGRAHSEMPGQEPGNDVAGKFTIATADRLHTLMVKCAGEFKVLHPNVQCQVEGYGTTSGPSALTEGTSEVCAMFGEFPSRILTRFQSKYGRGPVRMCIGADAVAVYVHDASPIEEVSLEQLRSLFGRETDAGVPIKHWGQLGGTGVWSSREVVPIGRRDSSAFDLFKAKALHGKEFGNQVQWGKTSKDILNRVSNEQGAIGFTTTGLVMPKGVKVLRVRVNGGPQSVTPNAEAIQSGSYPMTSQINVYCNGGSDERFRSPLREFMLFMLSVKGQGALSMLGYTPLGPSQVSAEKSTIR